MNRLTFISLLIEAIEDRAVLTTATVSEFNSVSSLEFLNFIRNARINGVTDEALLAEANHQIFLSEGDVQAGYVKEMEAKNLLLEHQQLGLESEVRGLKAQMQLQKLETELASNSVSSNASDNLAYKIVCVLFVAAFAFTGGVFVGSLTPTNTNTPTYSK